MSDPIRRSSKSLSALLGAGCFLLLALVPAHRAGGTEKDFEEALQVVDRTIASGKAKKAKELLLAELETRRDQTYVLYHLTEITDDLRRATFWSANTKPDPKTVISGELVSWSPTTGQIKVRYRLDPSKEGATKKTGPGKATTADFTRQGALWIHPVIFDGPFTIEVKGSAYPSFSEPVKPPSIYVCGDWNQVVCVSFGLRSDGGSKYLPARILRFGGGETETLAAGEPQGVPGEEFDAKVVVTATSVTGSLNNRTVLSTSRSEPIDGCFAFANFPAATEVLVTGKVTQTWLMNAVDSAVQERWSGFENSYKSGDDLPAWLREKAYGGVVKAEESEWNLPEEKTPKGTEHTKAFASLLDARKFDAALEWVEKVPAGEVSESTRALFQAIALGRLGRKDEALAACTRACVAEPRCLFARMMKVNLEGSQKHVRERIENLKALVADFPKESEPYVELAKLEMLDGHPEDARTLVRTAIDAGVAAGTLERTEHLVARALKGPLWPKSFEYKSEHYTVTSDISQRLCFDAASLLEKFYTKFNLHLRHVPPQEKRVFRVFLFSGKAGYENYTRDLVGRAEPNTLGLYFPIVKQLLIWNQPDSERMMETVRHEGFHQYLDRLTEDSPVWLNEGLAVYYQASKLVKGAWSDGEIQAEYVEVLAKKPLVPLEEFVKIPHAAFYDSKRVDLNYAQGWAFVHFLLSSGPENKKIFDRLLDAIIGGTKSEAAIEQVFPKATLARLEPEFAAYVKKLR